jgi:lipoprotein-releasing system permease protein
MKFFDFVTVSLSAIIISFLATIYPAWQAAKLNPVEPLRYE